MANLSDIQNTARSGYTHIDALLDEGPDWNYLTPVGNTILYTFSVSSGNEVRKGVPVTGQSEFSASQQASARSAMAYISQLTGITFSETASGEAAQVHLANIDIPSFDTTGLCSWNVSYSSNSSTGELVSYKANAYVYLDNREHAAANNNLAPGGQGYETLLHELGHMLGLKHPHEEDIQLPFVLDTTASTLMSYEHSGGPYAAFNSLDLAALNWIYGGDGLRGALGINSVTGARFLTGTADADSLAGTAANDTLKGDGGNDMINGGAGNDTAVFGGMRAAYNFSDAAGGQLLVQGQDGSDTLDGIELLKFDDGVFMRSQVVDNVAPGAPAPNVAKNANGYVVGNTPVVFGIAEANATIKIFNGSTQVGTGKVDANGFFNIATSGLPNGSYTLTATATDAAGNVSAASVGVSFKVDATAPAVPTATLQLEGAGGATSNQPLFAGTAEAGSTISLVNSDGKVVGQAEAALNGSWSIAPNPLANGAYSVSVRSSDDADNVTAATNPLNFTINSALNRAGGAGNDTLTGTSGNNALSGMSGIDTAVYGGARGGYTIAKSTNGFTISSAADGRDSLLDIERLKFSDASLALDIDGNGGQAYRLYAAVLGRDPDLPGLGFWINALDAGFTLERIGSDFLASKEFADVYGSNLTTAQFVDRLYQNVLHRPLDAAGNEFWVKAIDERGAERVDVLVAFSESTENKDQVIDTIGNGFAYVPWNG